MAVASKNIGRPITKADQVFAVISRNGMPVLIDKKWSSCRGVDYMVRQPEQDRALRLHVIGVRVVPQSAETNRIEYCVVM